MTGVSAWARVIDMAGLCEPRFDHETLGVGSVLQLFEGEPDV